MSDDPHDPPPPSYEAARAAGAAPLPPGQQQPVTIPNTQYYDGATYTSSNTNNTDAAHNVIYTPPRVEHSPSPPPLVPMGLDGADEAIALQPLPQSAMTVTGEPAQRNSRSAPKVVPLHLLSEKSEWIDCQFCKKRTQTRIIKKGAKKQLFIVLDALDESATRPELLTYIREMADMPGLAHTQLLCTGRPEKEFSRDIPSLIGEDNCIALDKEEINADILSFRWAACQLDSLENCLDREEIEAALDSLPRDLHETYTRMLDRIPAGRKQKSIRLLQFLSHAKKPITLREAVDIIAIRIDQIHRSFNGEDRMPDPSEIIGFCPSLVSIVQAQKPYHHQATWELHLAHFSVKEYLQKGNVPGFLGAEPDISITHTCLTYLSSIREMDQNTAFQFPLAKHAAQMWIDHARPAEESGDVVEVVVKFLQSDKTFRLWTRFHQPDKPWDDDPGGTQASCLYFACLKGLVKVVQKLVLMGADINAQGGIYDNALHAASYTGRQYVAGFSARDISRSLAWYANPGFARHSHYVGPSWSWASGSGGVRFLYESRHGPDAVESFQRNLRTQSSEPIYCTAVVDSYNIERVTSDPFSRISSAEIFMTAPILNAVVHPDREKGGAMSLWNPIDAEKCGYLSFDVQTDAELIKLWKTTCGS